MFKEIKKVRTPHHFLIDIMEDIKEIKLNHTSSIYYVHEDKIVFEFDFMLRHIWVHYGTWKRIQDNTNYHNTRKLIKKIFKTKFDDHDIIFTDGDPNYVWSNNYHQFKHNSESFNIQL